MPLHAIDGETCPECGRVHEVVESIPGRPASKGFLDALEDSDRFTFARAAGWSPAGKDGKVVAEDIVLGTDEAASYLVLAADDIGWFVMDEREVEDDETVEAVVTELLEVASSQLPRDGHH